MKYSLSAGLAIALALFSGAAFAQDKTKVGVWTQSDEHYVPPASCHPHCHPDEGDNVNWQVPYPDDIALENFRTVCRDMGGACAFDSSSITIDPAHHVATVSWRNRSDQVWVRLQADEMK